MRTKKNSLLLALKQEWRRLTASPLVVWDVGAVTTQVHIGQRQVFSQASCIALNLQTNRVAAYGDAAYRLLGNSGNRISVMFPVDKGCLTDIHASISWLEYVRAQLWPRRRWLTGLRTPKGILRLSEGVGKADQQIWTTALERAGLTVTSSVSGLIGLSWYLNLATAEESCFVLDIGGSQTQIGVLIRGTVVGSKTIGWGGIDLTTQLQAWVLQKYHCQISWRAAEHLKCTYGSLASDRIRTAKTAITGKDPFTQLGMTATIELQQLQQMLISAQSDLVLTIQQFLASLPAEVATTCLENGLWIAGGSAQLDGLDRWLSITLGTTVSRVQDPVTAASKGLAIWAAAQEARKQ